VERPGDLEGEYPRPGGRSGAELGESIESSGDDDLPTAVEVGRLKSEFLEPGEERILIAAENGTHAGRNCSRSGGHRGCAGRYEAHGGDFIEDPSADRGGDLPDRVTSNGRGCGQVCVGRQSPKGEQTGGDDERLGNPGVTDGVGVRRRAMGDEVQTGDLRVLLKQPPVGRVIKPRRKETGRLGALAWAYENNHATSLPITVAMRVWIITQEWQVPLCMSHRARGVHVSDAA
jgi:hypothetical protein